MAAPRLRDLDLTLSLSAEEERERLKAAQLRLLALRLQLGGKLGDGRLGPPVCIVFEGWDASGKGGAIKRLISPLDPRHVRVAAFGAPTLDEKRPDFRWRFEPVRRGWGDMSMLDRGAIIVKFWLHISEAEQLIETAIAEIERGMRERGVTPLD
jgi:polyphosphate kinase 2 (PPK2 family)